MNKQYDKLLNQISSQNLPSLSTEYLALNKELLNLSVKNNNIYYQTVAHYNISYYYHRKCNIEESIRQAILSCNLSEENGILEYYIKSCNMLGICYNITFEHFMSLEYFLKGYYCCEDIKDYSYQIRIVNNIGNIFLYLGEYEEAINQYKKALRLKKEKHAYLHEGAYCLILLNLVECYIALDKQKTAQNLIEMVRPILKEQESKMLNFVILSNQAVLSFRSGEKAKAKEAIQKLLSITENYTEYEHLYCCYNRIKDVIFGLSDSEIYREYLEKLKWLTDQIDDYNFKSLYQVETIRYAKLQNDHELYVKALENHYNLAQNGAKSRKDTFSSSLFAKLELEKLIHERARIISQRNEYRELSQIDGLTQILNRYTVEEKIRNYLTTKVEGQVSALLLFDVDNFKIINDTLGHIGGDEVLKIIAKAMNTTFLADDTIGRLGGDEFVIYMNNISIDTEVAEEICQEKIQVLRDNIQKLVQHLSIEVTISLGTVLIKNNQQQFESLYQLADKSLYEAKNSGKNRTVISDIIV